MPPVNRVSSAATLFSQRKLCSNAVGRLSLSHSHAAAKGEKEFCPGRRQRQGRTSVISMKSKVVDDIGGG